MKFGNFAPELADELADLRAEQEREAGIRAARKALAVKGSLVCVGCGEEIEAERRAAMPSARSCLQCQQRIERFRRRH